MHANTKISRRNEVPTENRITYSNRRKPWGESKLCTPSTMQKEYACDLADEISFTFTLTQKSAL